MSPILTRMIGSGSAGTGFGFGRRRNVGSSIAARSFSIDPSLSGKTTWNLDTDGAINITSGDYTITALSPYTFTSYIWGSGGGSASYSGGAGGFASGSFSGSTGDIYALKGGFGAGGPNGGNAYGIFATSFTHANSRLIVGGGGGGSSSVDGPSRSSAGGAGGGSSGERAGLPSEPQYNSITGFGGTQSAGGSNGGSALQGGNGSSSPGPSGGGGGGYYGGGGGGFICCSVNAGGGGGSGYTHPSLTNPINNTGNFSTVAPSPPAASPLRGTAGNVAQPGRLYIN